jgi:hypothetical protein
VDVGGGDDSGKRYAPPINEEVVLGAALPLSTALGRCGLPFFAGMLAELRAALDQSMSPCFPSRSCRVFNSRR